MTLGDLLGSKVFDENGRKVGPVFDVEARRTGPFVSESWGNALQIDMLMVGQNAFILRLGYMRRGVRGPVGLHRLAHRLKGFAVAWDDIAAIEERKIVLNKAISELRSLEEWAQAELL